MIHNISDINLWELGTTISELQNKTWEQIKNGSNTRIRTKNLFPCSSSLKVKISSNYNIDLLWFNEEGLMISEIETNWTQGNNDEFIPISVPNDAKQVGILVRFTNNSTISPSEILNTNIYYDDGLLSNNSIIAENIINIMIGEIPALKMYFGNDLIWNSALPYDAEIEYLYVNSSKGCYIDTGIIPNANTGVYAKLYISHINDEYIIGLRNDTTDTRWLIGHTDIGWYCGYGQSIFIEDNRQPYTDAIYEIELNFKNSGKMSNLTTNASKNLPILNFIPENSITIFKANCFDGALTNQSFMSASCRIYGVKISQGNDIIMDLIPVRVGLTGYMYDKISGQLFENAGSGDFVLGLDKT